MDKPKEHILIHNKALTSQRIYQYIPKSDTDWANMHPHNFQPYASFILNYIFC